MDSKKYSIEIGVKELVAEFTNWTNQANGSVLVRYGNSTVLATAVMGNKDSNLDYFPLSVEYEEKFYATGSILGSQYMRREGRPSEEAILSGRMVDRTIRPLFPKELKRDVQVIITVLALDEDDTDVLAINAASLALATSNIPWNGPAGAVRVGLINGSDDFVVNPTYTQRTEDSSRLDLLVCGKDELINMTEVGALEIPEETLVRGFEKANEELKRLQEWQESIVTDRGAEKWTVPTKEENPEINNLFDETIRPQLHSNGGLLSKEDFGRLKSEWQSTAAERLEDASSSEIDDYYEHMVDEHVHDLTLKEGKRVDGRAFDEIRELYAKAGGISPMIHGTGLFFRGETHVLGALTLGGPGDAQTVDTIESHDDSKKTFMLHYNFPPFSVGETGRVGGTNRRMVGHGALAEKALRAVIPPQDVFPYTIRIVSECLASNGSTSQATICAGTLALMDAGVPITRPVAGIAMGMMSDKNGNYKILTDIQGPEDHHGDMDFKVAGTVEGVTAVQMDVKVAGVPLKALAEAFEQAKKARLQIIDVILAEIPEPRTDISPRAPKIIAMHVKEDQIGLVIGPGGKMINGIKDATGVEDITIEDDGSVFITGRDGSAERAAKAIEQLTHEYKAGEKYEGEVTKILDFGAFVKIAPGTEGLVHISEIAPFRIEKVTDALSEGERVSVIIKEIDEKKRINLSIKDIDPQFAENKGLKPTTPSAHERSEQHNNEAGDTGGDGKH